MNDMTSPETQTRNQVFLLFRGFVDQTKKNLAIALFPQAKRLVVGAIDRGDCTHSVHEFLDGIAPEIRCLPFDRTFIRVGGRAAKRDELMNIISNRSERTEGAVTEGPEIQATELVMVTQANQKKIIETVLDAIEIHDTFPEAGELVWGSYEDPLERNGFTVKNISWDRDNASDRAPVVDKKEAGAMGTDPKSDGADKAYCTEPTHSSEEILHHSAPFADDPNEHISSHDWSFKNKPLERRPNGIRERIGSASHPEVVLFSLICAGLLVVAIVT